MIIDSYELHNGVEPRLRTGNVNKRTAYEKVEEQNNREKKSAQLLY